MSPVHAAQLADMLVNVVDNGTGSNAQIPGVRVAGKTGTAQTGNDNPAVAWFVAFAPAQAPKVLRQLSANGDTSRRLSTEPARPQPRRLHCAR